MIIYEKGGFDGPAKLFRVHGSAVYKSFLPAIFSSVVSFMYDYAEFSGTRRAHVPFVRDIFRANIEEDYTIIRHPYTINAFIAIFSLLITFRLNFAYSRYWEGATSVYGMISKWLDVAILLVRLQCIFLSMIQ